MRPTSSAFFPRSRHMKPVIFGMLVMFSLGSLFAPAAKGVEIKTMAWPVPQTIPGTKVSHAILHNYGQGY